MSGVLPATVVLERIGLEKGRLANACRTLLVAGPAAARLESMGGERLRALLSSVSSDLDGLAAAVRRHGVDEPRLAKLRDLHVASDRVLSELLAMAVGALAREFAMDNGGCEEADRFIRQMAGRIDRRLARPTVPASQEYVHRAADVVRRRIPDHGLWDLPVMAHEFGHVVVTGLQPYDAIGDQLRRPAEDWLRGRVGMARRRAEELFCDMFATFATGPAYACCLVLHRMDPASPATPEIDSTHPSDAQRVHACLRTLHRMGRGGPEGWYEETVWHLERAWTALQRAAPESARLADTQLAEVNTDVAACWAILVQDLAAVRLPSATHVDDLVDELKTGVPADPGFSAVDVLNAAWVERLEAWSAGGPLADAVTTRAGQLLSVALAAEGPSS